MVCCPQQWPCHLIDESLIITGAWRPAARKCKCAHRSPPPAGHFILVAVQPHVFQFGVKDRMGLRQRGHGFYNHKTASLGPHLTS